METYIHGLQFVGLYYYKGVPSWSWYFNHYYSPLASDLYLYLKHKNEKKDHSITFELDKPFPPIK
jgi:5'-3' exoribonuclease 1